MAIIAIGMKKKIDNKRQTITLLPQSGKKSTESSPILGGADWPPDSVSTARSASCRASRGCSPLRQAAEGVSASHTHEDPGPRLGGEGIPPARVVRWLDWSLLKLAS